MEGSESKYDLATVNRAFDLTGGFKMQINSRILFIFFLVVGSTADAQQRELGISLGAAQPSGALTRAFGLGSTVEIFGSTNRWVVPFDARLAIGYTWLPATTTWHVAATSIEPSIGFAPRSVAFAPSVFAGPGWYSIAEKATQSVSVGGVESSPHSFRRSAFGMVAGMGIELNFRGTRFPIALKHHSVPGLRVGSGATMKFNTLSLGVSF